MITSGFNTLQLTWLQVVCRCGAYICYICGRQIRGYEHFDNGSCQIFEVDPQWVEEERLAM